MLSKNMDYIDLMDDLTQDALIRVPLENGETVFFPIYKQDFMPDSSCAKYARRAANYFFYKDYSQADHAWNLRYIYETIPLKNFGSQEASRELVSGDLVGIHYPRSNYLKGTDIKGKPRDYTHT